MSAIISDKFRIYNAEQFISALGDDFYDDDGNPIGTYDPTEERNTMYFFVGRPQRWEVFLETYGRLDVLAGWDVGAKGATISVANSSNFTASIAEVYDAVNSSEGNSPTGGNGADDEYVNVISQFNNLLGGAKGGKKKIEKRK